MNSLNLFWGLDPRPLDPLGEPKFFKDFFKQRKMDISLIYVTENLDKQLPTALFYSPVGLSCPSLISRSMTPISGVSDFPDR